MNDALRARDRGPLPRRCVAAADRPRTAGQLHSVRRTLREIEQARVRPPTPQPRRAAVSSTPSSRRSATCLARYPDITAQRVLEELRAARLHGRVHGRPRARAAAPPPPVVAPVRRFETAPGFKHKWIIPPMIWTSATRAAAACTPSATCWATRGGSTCTSSRPRTSPPRCASTSAPSSTWAGSRRRASMTT